MTVSGDAEAARAERLAKEAWAAQLLEPRIWSHITDTLPRNHPLAYQSLSCAVCRVPIHAANNECMQTWVETGKGNYCLGCFTGATGEVVDDEWGLPPTG